MSGFVFVLYQSTPLQRRRLEALNVHVPVTLIEVVRKSGHYDWGSAGADTEYPVIILFNESQDEAVEERAVAEALGKLSPEVIFVMGYARRFSRAATAYALRHRLPSVLISDSTANEASTGWFVSTIKRWLVGAHNAAFVAGSAQARQIEALGMSCGQIFCGYDVVDNAWISERVAEAPNVENGPFLCVSRLIWQKNLQTLIDAFAVFCAECPESTRELHIAGYGGLCDELRDKIRVLGLEDRIRLLGAVAYSDMPACYAGASAFFLASKSEPWGLVVNEAMAAGLPVAVSSAVGCVEDLVEEGRNGYVFDPNDVSALVRTMSALERDADRRLEMGRASQEIISGWTLETYSMGAISAARASQENTLSMLARLKGDLAVRLLRQRRDKIRGFERKS